jgi:hypothetical protein
LAKQTIRPQSIGVGTLNGLAVDAQSFDEAMVVLDVGTLTTGSLTVTVEESVDGSTGWTAVAGAAFAAVTSANDEAVYVGTITLEGSRKRFLRAVAVVATAACLDAITIHLGRPVSLPAQTPAFSV